MTNYQHGTNACNEANAIRYKIAHSKGETQKKLRELLEAHKKSCPICNAK
jgi:hypothetical protein